MRLLLLSRSALLTERLERPLAAAGHVLLPYAGLGTLRPALLAERPEVVLLATAHGPALCGELRAELAALPEGARRPRLVVLSPDAADDAAAHEAGALFLRLPFSEAELLALLQVAGRERKLILLCDDSALIHRHTTPVLKEAGYDVHSARDGQEGVEAAAALHPDLVLSDIEMPRLDGYGVCRAVKARWPHLPVILCSTLSEAHDIERGFDAGADDYLVKPAQPAELLSRVEGLLSRSLPEAGTRERLLVVEDSPPIRQLVADSLRRQGFQVITAPDGEAGLSRARSERPAMIITDYDMPRMTGFEMVHALRQDEATRHIPVMMLTARDSRRDQAQMRAVGLSAYLVKPFSVDKCVAMVERVLAEQRLRAYKVASRLYISEAAMSAAEQAARSGDPFKVRAREQEASILFSDISGFTTLSTKKSPREVVELLNSFFDALCPIIREEGGDIDKFIGDAIMAVFDERPDHPRPYPLRAVRAALRMQAALLDWSHGTGHELRMRIGINTGSVVRGDIGSRHVRRDYTVIGDVVNRAQRFEGNAPVGGVLISESTYELVKGAVRCEPRPGIRLKGVDEPVQAYVALELLPDPA